MSVQTLLGEGDFFAVQPYQKSLHDLEAEAVAFIGSLRQHYNPHMLLLLTRPLEPQGTAFEFRSEDVICAEEAAQPHRSQWRDRRARPALGA
jgi:hypothetical protein